ncbi:MAG: right-handed parallel beta-helix repeat-containing protein [Nanoarchaeota archaeon]|nr:right-handed parallel beta-helix repeat-containing protein [Nanoarchaeota archaeon]
MKKIVLLYGLLLSLLFLVSCGMIPEEYGCYECRIDFDDLEQPMWFAVNTKNEFKERGCTEHRKIQEEEIEEGYYLYGVPNELEEEPNFKEIARSQFHLHKCQTNPDSTDGWTLFSSNDCWLCSGEGSDIYPSDEDMSSDTVRCLRWTSRDDEVHKLLVGDPEIELDIRCKMINEDNLGWRDEDRLPLSVAVDDILEDQEQEEERRMNQCVWENDFFDEKYINEDYEPILVNPKTYYFDDSGLNGGEDNDYCEGQRPCLLIPFFCDDFSHVPDYSPYPESVHCYDTLSTAVETIFNDEENAERDEFIFKFYEGDYDLTNIAIQSRGIDFKCLSCRPDDASVVLPEIVSYSTDLIMDEKSVQFVGMEDQDVNFIAKSDFGLVFRNSKGSMIKNINLYGSKLSHLMMSDFETASAPVLLTDCSEVVFDDVEFRNVEGRSPDAFNHRLVFIMADSSAFLVRNSRFEHESPLWIGITDSIYLADFSKAMIIDNIFENVLLEQGGLGSAIGVDYGSGARVIRNVVKDYDRAVQTKSENTIVDVQNNLIISPRNRPIDIYSDQAKILFNTIYNFNEHDKWKQGEPPIMSMIENKVIGNLVYSESTYGTNCPKKKDSKYCAIFSLSDGLEEGPRLEYISNCIYLKEDDNLPAIYPKYYSSYFDEGNIYANKFIQKGGEQSVFISRNPDSLLDFRQKADSPCLLNSWDGKIVKTGIFGGDYPFSKSSDDDIKFASNGVIPILRA